MVRVNFYGCIFRDLEAGHPPCCYDLDRCNRDLVSSGHIGIINYYVSVSVVQGLLRQRLSVRLSTVMPSDLK